MPNWFEKYFPKETKKLKKGEELEDRDKGSEVEERDFKSVISMELLDEMNIGYYIKTAGDKNSCTINLIASFNYYNWNLIESFKEGDLGSNYSS